MSFATKTVVKNQYLMKHAHKTRMDRFVESCNFKYKFKFNTTQHCKAIEAKKTSRLDIG